MGDHFPWYFNNLGQLIINVSWQVAGVDGKLGEGEEGYFFFSSSSSWKWHEHFKAFTLRCGEPFTKDLISDSNRPAQLR